MNTDQIFSIKLRIHDSITINPETGCWIWNKRITEYGYGAISIFGKVYRAHRVSYRVFNGRIINNLLVCHKCDVRKCVNPEHLYLGTHQDNMDDMKRSGIQKKGRVKVSGALNGSAKLTDEKAISIFYDNRMYKEISKDYGVSSSVVGAIKRKQKWKHIHKP